MTSLYFIVQFVINTLLHSLLENHSFTTQDEWVMITQFQPGTPHSFAVHRFSPLQLLRKWVKVSNSNSSSSFWNHLYCLSRDETVVPHYDEWYLIVCLFYSPCWYHAYVSQGFLFLQLPILLNVCVMILAYFSASDCLSTLRRRQLFQ